ncbi:MAG: hypothetical protein GKR94_16700 [Gammaproteobacteria bacterium]|nr:hypothetical protein [Gammaproteobacteria bacterium]
MPSIGIAAGVVSPASAASQARARRERALLSPQTHYCTRWRGPQIYAFSFSLADWAGS